MLYKNIKRLQKNEGNERDEDLNILIKFLLN